jgi:hypothetical protein
MHDSRMCKREDSYHAADLNTLIKVRVKAGQHLIILLLVISQRAVVFREENIS